MCFNTVAAGTVLHAFFPSIAVLEASHVAQAGFSCSIIPPGPPRRRDYRHDNMLSYDDNMLSYDDNS